MQPGMPWPPTSVASAPPIGTQVAADDLNVQVRHLRAELNSLTGLVAGLGRVLNTIGMLSILTTERVTGVSREELIPAIEKDLNDRAFQKLVELKGKAP